MINTVNLIPKFLARKRQSQLFPARSDVDHLVHSISIYIVKRVKVGDIYIVTARAHDRLGRDDESTGAVPLALLQDGLATLDAMGRQAPGADVPTFDPPTTGDPDVSASAALVAGLKVRAARLGITEAQFQTWLDTQQLPMENGQLRLSVGERERLNVSFNAALDAAKAEMPRPAARRGGKKASAAD